MIYDNELYRELRPYLNSDEAVLWVGKSTGKAMYKGALFTAVFSLFFMVFSVVWMTSAAMAGGPFFLFGIPFLLIGVGLFCGTTVGRKKGLMKSIYAVTERRAIILAKMPFTGTRCKEYIFSNLQYICLENVKNGVGTIRFEDPSIYHYRSDMYTRTDFSYNSGRDLTTGFIMIDNVHDVYRMISERLGK